MQTSYDDDLVESYIDVAVTLTTPTQSGTITLNASVTGTTLTTSLEIKITSSWHSIFTIGTTETTNDTVTGFTDDYATYINGYVDGTNTLTFPTDENVKFVNANAFKNLIVAGTGCATAGVESIVIPANITTIGANAFNNDTTTEANSIIKQVQILGATEIGTQAFINNKVLTNLFAPNGVNVGTSAFEADNALKTINLGRNKTTVIGQQAFANIQGTDTITLTANPAEIGDFAFNESTKLEWEGINKVNAITSIGQGAFTGCQLLPTGSELAINNKLANATISDNAFFATGIEKIKLIEQTADTMYANWGNALFSNCMSLSEIDISEWSSIPSNLSSKESLDLFLMSGSANTNTWYYKSTLSESMLATFEEWMEKQFGDAAPNWTKATR